MMLPFRHSDERIAWLIFDIMSRHQKSNPRDEIAEPPPERRSVPERQHHFATTSTSGQGPAWNRRNAEKTENTERVFKLLLDQRLPTPRVQNHLYIKSPPLLPILLPPMKHSPWQIESPFSHRRS